MVTTEKAPVLTRETLWASWGYSPTEAQRTILDDPHKDKLVAGGWRGGKALWVETEIPTPQGFRQMCQLRAGDEVFAPDGEPTKVLWASEVMYGRDVYRVEFDDGSEIYADAEHQWVTRDYNDRKATFRSDMPQNNRSGTRTTEQIANSIWYGESLKYKKGPYKNHSIDNPLPVQYPRSVLPVDPYTLGAWLGDGNSADAGFTTADPEILDELAKRGYPAHQTPSRTGGYGWYLDNLYKNLRLMGLLRNKHIPRGYMEAEDVDRVALLQGLMDTDGYIDKRSHCHFYNTNETLALAVRELLASLGIKASIRTKPAKLNGIFIGDSYDVYFRSDFSPFLLPRKDARWKPQNVRQGHRYIVAAEKVKSRPVKCIGVAHDSHMYLAGRDYIPTHNSQTAAALAATETLYFLGKYGKEAAGQVAWLVANNYELTRAEYNYTAALLRNSPVGTGLRALTRVDPGEIRIPVPGGGVFTIKTKSASDPQTLAMEAPVWVIVCEAAQVSIDVFENLKGRVVEARQRYPEFGWLFLEGTFEGSLGWYASLWQKWQSPAMHAQGQKSYSLPTHTNTILFPGGENDPAFVKLREDTPEALFSEKYLGVPVPPSGRVHATFDPAVHVRSLKYNPDLPVYLGIDPGYSGQPSTYAVEAAQLVPVGESGFQQWQIFDEIAMNKFDKPGFAAQDVVYQAMQRPWWKNQMKHGVIDVAGTQHNATNPDSNAEIWRKTAGIVLYHQPQQIKNQIDRVDLSLKADPVTGEPGLLIDPKAKLIISELGGAPNPYDGQVHVYSWPQNRQNEVIGKVPKDQYCDGIKAFAYLALNVQGPVFDSTRGGTIRVKRRRRYR